MGSKSASRPRRSIISKIQENNIIRLLLVIVIILLFAAVSKPKIFFTAVNFQSIAVQLSEYGLMALGVGICMISGGIDLSAVYVANLCGISAAVVMQKLAASAGVSMGVGILLGVMTAVVIGVACGGFNGFLISFLRIPPMLATLGTYQLYMGISIVISKGSSVGGIPKVFTYISRSMLLKYIPLPFAVFALGSALLALIMRYTKFGKRVYLVGTSMVAAKYAGIKTKKIIIQTYMISGFLASLAGILSLARITSAKADFGSNYTMQCILISVLGGINPNGGFGSIEGVAISVLILQSISSLLNMFPQISNYFRDLIWGAALILVLITNLLIEKRLAKNLLKSSK